MAKAAKKNYKNVSGVVQIRYSHKEIADIDAAAKELGTDRSDYLRKKISNGLISVRFVDQSYLRMVYELNKIGVNLNQYLTRFKPDIDRPELAEEVAGMISTLRILIAELKKKLV
jgi:hypothetical protein